MGFKVAVVGATGNVGREMLNILDERRFPADEVIAVASRKSQGVDVSFGDRTLKCKALEPTDFSDVDICLMSAGGSVSKEWSPKIGAQGAIVIRAGGQIIGAIGCSGGTGSQDELIAKVGAAALNAP